MRSAIVTRQIRSLIAQGITLEQALEKVEPAVHDRMRKAWADVASRKPRKTPGYREAVAYIAMNDEASNLCNDPESPDYIGAMPTVLLTAMLFGKTEHEVATDVLAYRQKDRQS